MGAARRLGDDGGGANVRQRRPVGEEAASGSGGGQIRQSRDAWGRRGRQAALGEEVTSAGAATTGGEGGDVGRRAMAAARGERRKRARAEEAGRVRDGAGRGGEGIRLGRGRLGPLLGLSSFSPFYDH